MQLNLIEQDIKSKEESLRRCRSNLLGVEAHDEIRLLSHEVFLLEDQLKMYRVIVGILKEDQGSYDEMLPKV